MKPLKLIISAFGPYADIQEIDFAELGENGLYLITGETGSGKTTIFDAISFALYGKASGTARDYSMFRSDFVSEKAKTFVELDFVSGDKHYKINRTIKKTGQDVVLILPEGTLMSGERNIKPKIAEIIGLDRDQFAQIIMIAQNDFLRFLQSGTEERLKILRRIFGTEALKQFQEQLKILVRQESDKRALILHDFERYEVNIYKRSEQFVLWETQIKSDKKTLSETEKKLAEHDKQKQKLAAELAIAEDVCRKFDELSKFLRDSEAHNLMSDKIKELKIRAARGETALYKVKPLYDEAEKTALTHSSAQTDLKNAKDRETAAIAEAEEAAKIIESLPPLAEAQEAFAALSKEWETANTNLNQLTNLQLNRSEISGKQSALAAKQKELHITLDSLNKLLPVSDCQTELEKIINDLNSNKEKLNKLSAAQNDFSIIINKQNELKKEQEKFDTLNASFSDADAQYKALEEVFLRNQAGIIAQNLTDGMPCPVCGSVEHPAPAKISDNDISENKLNKAREVKEKEQSKREAQVSVCAVLKTEIETLLKRFMSDILPMILDVTFETAKDLLTANINAVNSKVTELSKKKDTAEKSLAELKLNLENLTNKRDELTPITASLKSEIETLTKRFLSDFSVFVKDVKWESSESELKELLSQTKKTAEELTIRKENNKKSLDELSLKWETAINRKNNAEAAKKSAETLVIERNANEQKFSILRNEALSAFKASLRENSFSDDADYKKALIQETELNQLKKQISDYDKQGEQLARDIARLEKETTDINKPDIESLRNKTEALDAESQILNDQRDEIKSRLEKNENALIYLRTAAADFEKAEKSYAAVKQLSDTANGKLDFETYAQMVYFERVLRAANLRLKIMSQNRYTLLRKTDSDDGRKRSGLELEVLDAYTGKTRSANSLSGGESFMASLSLALGLSDVVQQSAGGIRLDAMFIDEGFGTLDTDVLELAVRTLSEMAGTSRSIGIISHVTELRERIDRQIKVEKTASGSRISIAK